MLIEDFKAIIDNDIILCETAAKSYDKNFLSNLHTTLKSKYGKIIDGFTDELYDIFYDDSCEYRKSNIEIMRQKLVLFKAMGYENKYSSHRSNNVVVNNNNHIEATFNITFEDAKRRIENMTSLRDDEIEEIKHKIDELEKIVLSDDRKTKKWERAKDILKWVADKGVDVGITMMPLWMKMC